MAYLLTWTFPILAGLLSWFTKKQKLNSAIILIHSLLHLALGITLALPSLGLAARLGVDDLGVSIFLVSAVLYFAVGIYSLGYESHHNPRQSSIYTVCMMLFVAAMDGAILAHDLGLIWVFVETTTLASAMLISLEHHRQSLEAAWKYLFICSIGIALAFVGILLLVIAQPTAPTLILTKLFTATHSLSPFWLKISFVFMLIGFGTKVGLAPLHFWLPDAHSEAPAPVSALLSGALLNTALIPLLRMQHLMQLNDLGELAAQLFLLLGFASLFIAAVFINRVQNFKRLLAYSSIENMGIIMIAFSLGTLAGKAGLLHVMGHSLIKGAFFLTAGNLYSIYSQKTTDKCSGLLAIDPRSGWLWLLCFAFISGMPPSPLFLSEFYIAMGFIKGGNIIGFIAFFLLLASIAYGLGRASLAITMGDSERRVRLRWSSYLPQMGLLIFAAVFYLWLI